MTLAALFSPQGSQAVGMGRELASASAAARATFEEADATLGWPVSATCWDGPADRLDDTRQDAAVPADGVGGRGSGARRAGIRLPERGGGPLGGRVRRPRRRRRPGLPSALRLVARRGQLMADADSVGGMAAVIGLDRDAVETVVDRVGRPTELVVANDNAPGQVVISGVLDALAAAEEPMRAAGARRVMRLPVSGAFHSPLMAGVADELAAAFETEPWSDALIPVISNVTAEPLTDADRVRRAPRGAGPLAGRVGSLGPPDRQGRVPDRHRVRPRQCADRDGQTDRSGAAPRQRGGCGRYRGRGRAGDRCRGAGIGVGVVSKVLIANRGEIAVRVCAPAATSGCRPSWPTARPIATPWPCSSPTRRSASVRRRRGRATSTSRQSSARP